jgi:hypothetical protein
MEIERWLNADVIQLDHYDHHSFLRSEHLKAARPYPGIAPASQG